MSRPRSRRLIVGGIILVALYVLTAPFVLPKVASGRAAYLYSPFIYSLAQDWPGRRAVCWYFYDICRMNLYFEVKRVS